LVISLPAKIAVLFDALFPEMTSDLFALANRLLPEAGGIDEREAKGKAARPCRRLGSPHSTSVRQ
jgi:hypothetical protein